MRLVLSSSSCYCITHSRVSLFLCPLLLAWIQHSRHLLADYLAFVLPCFLLLTYCRLFSLQFCYAREAQFSNVNLCCQLSVLFPSVFLHCWFGDRKGIRPVKSWVLVCWWWRFDWSFACPTAPVVTTISIILTSNKIQNGDILVLANPGSPGKWPLNWRERERERVACA